MKLHTLALTTHSLSGHSSAVPSLDNGGGNLRQLERSPPYQAVDDEEDEDDETKIYEDMHDDDDEHNYE